MRKIERLKIGLLPTYMHLFDQNLPEMNKEAEAFKSKILIKLKDYFEVYPVPIAKEKSDFIKSIELFENKSVDAIVMLYLAYSLSGMAIKALSSTYLPIIILDTTPDYYFGPDHEPSRILYNHGIHGVQDLCNNLIKNGKKFFIEAGHWEKSGIFPRVHCRVRQAKMVNAFFNIRLGRIGDSFKGMDDFRVSDRLLSEKYGFKIIQADAIDIINIEKKISDKEIDEEIKSNEKRYMVSISNKKNYLDSIRCGLAIRKWRIDNNLKAFIANAFYFSKDNGIPFVPFLEASKAMAEGIGYAGEGDILSAAFSASLMSSFPDSTFTEMFCPDWANGSIFLSHAGEVNINLIEGKAKIIEKSWAFSKGHDPVSISGRLKAGKCLLCTLSPVGDENFRLIVSKGDMLKVGLVDNFSNVIHGWFKPNMKLENFLREFSINGGIHHSVLVYDAEAEDIIEFGKMMDWDIIQL